MEGYVPFISYKVFISSRVWWNFVDSPAYMLMVCFWWNANRKCRNYIEIKMSSLTLCLYVSHLFRFSTQDCVRYRLQTSNQYRSFFVVNNSFPFNICTLHMTLHLQLTSDGYFVETKRKRKLKPIYFFRAVSVWITKLQIDHHTMRKLIVASSQVTKNCRQRIVATHKCNESGLCTDTHMVSFRWNSGHVNWMQHFIHFSIGFGFRRIRKMSELLH